MNANQQQHVPAVRGAMRRSEPMSRHSTWRCGGLAAQFFEPADRDDLLSFLRGRKDSDSIHWVGFGSNLLVRDGGVDGTVVSTARGLSTLNWTGQETAHAECGVSCARLAREADQHGYPKMAFLAGIPGTIGGALRMNAGALGANTWEFVERVELVDQAGSVCWSDTKDFEAGYRSVNVPTDQWFLGAEFNFSRPSTDAAAPTSIRAVRQHRAATQPTGQATCGSVFKNPVGDYAGRLIEECGLKSHRIGGCYISEVHANFFVNDGSACAQDVESLIEFVRDTVKSRTGVLLEPEVRIIGKPQGSAQ